MCADTDVCMSGRKTAVIILKMLGATVQNLVAWLTRRLEFPYPYSKVMSEVVIHPLTVNKQINISLCYIVIILTKLKLCRERNPITRCTWVNLAAKVSTETMGT